MISASAEQVAAAVDARIRDGRRFVLVALDGMGGSGKRAAVWVDADLPWLVAAG